MRQIAVVLRFVRFPLVWTALADVLAGAAVFFSSPGDIALSGLAPLMVISPALYLFGMAMNDLLDMNDDRLRGNNRPLARGELSAGAATGIIIFLLGLVLVGTACVSSAAMTMAILTLAAIAAYNGLAKRWTPTAMVFMSACRVGNVLIGWGAVSNNWRFDRDIHGRAPYAWALVVSVAALTAAASLASGLEKRRGLRRLLGMKPATVVLGCLLMLPVADCLCVMAAWGGSPWSLLWLAAIPLVVGSGAAVRRLSARAGPGRSPDAA